MHSYILTGPTGNFVPSLTRKGDSLADYYSPPEELRNLRLFA